MGKNLQNRRDPLVSFDEHLIPCNKSAHHLKNGDFYWEVKRSDDRDLSIGKSVAVRDLALPVSRNWESPGNEPRIIPTEILQESSCYVYFALNLNSWFWHYILNGFEQKVVDLLISKQLNQFGAYFPPLLISLRVFEWIVEAWFLAKINRLLY